MCDDKAASAAANKNKCEWAVRQVQPIRIFFAERCIYYLLIANQVCDDRQQSTASNKMCRQRTYAEYSPFAFFLLRVASATF